MPGSVRIEIDQEGAAALLKSQAVQDRLADIGERIAQAANAAADDPEAFTVERGTRGTTRTRVFVQTANRAGRDAEARFRALSKSLDAGR